MFAAWAETKARAGRIPSHRSTPVMPAKAGIHDFLYAAPA